MKNMLIGLLVLSSFNVFASKNFTITNRANKDMKIKFICISEQCKSLDVEYIDEKQAVSKNIVHLEEIIEESKGQLPRRGRFYKQGTFDLFPYELTRDRDTVLFHSVGFGEKLKNGTLLVLAAIAETILLPAEVIAYYSLTETVGKEDKEAARKLKRKVKRAKNIKINDKNFQIIKKYLNL